MLDVAHHADNLVRCLPAPLHKNALAGRIDTGKLLPRQRLAHDGHLRSASAIALAEYPPLDQRNGHSREVSRSHDGYASDRLFAGFGRGTACNTEPGGRTETAERRPLNGTGR